MDGTLVVFDQSKITNVIHRALLAANERDGKHAKNLITKKSIIF